ncbi:MAG: PKD domain-containing protein, partial [Verrucomicrobiales bacterium]|nr:PKD domain-containing protein [Verrucomicrobiales bacterium]
IGDMIDHHTDGLDIISDSLFLQSTGSIGNFVVQPNGSITPNTRNAFETQVNALEANVGSVYIANNQPLTIGGTEASNDGIQAVNVADVQLPGIMTVSENVLAGGDIILGAFDVEETQDSVLMDDGIKIESTGGDVTLLNGDVFTYNSTHRIIADGLLTIAMDQGNVDGGVGVDFSTPDTANRDIMQANELLIVTGPDDDNITIPDIYIPTRYEGGGGFDTVTARLVADPGGATVPNNRTTLMNIDVEDIDFTTEVTTDWLVDTAQQIDQYRTFEWDILSGIRASGLSLSIANSFLESDGIRVVENTHSNADAYRALTANYTFTDGEERVDVLQLDHVANLIMNGGDDLVKVGGIRKSTYAESPPRAEVAPFQVSQFLTVNAGEGDDLFLLEDPRTGQAVPFGRMGATEDGHGIIANYQIEGSPTLQKAIIFQEFESAVVNLGETDGIFTIEDTVVPTVINVDGDEDSPGGAVTTFPNGDTRDANSDDPSDTGFGNDVINIRKISHDVTINGGDGDDDFNIIGTGDAKLTINGQEHEKSLDLPTGGDRIRYGATRVFDGNVVNVLDAQNAIKLFGTGWETGDQVIFTTDGIAPAIVDGDGNKSTLVDGGIYYVVRQGRDIIRLTDTLEKAQELGNRLQFSSIPDDGLDVNLLTLLDGGQGNHQLTLAQNGVPLLDRTVGGLVDGDNGSPSKLVFNNPGSEIAVTIDDLTNTFTAADVSSLSNGQQVAVFAESTLGNGLESFLFYEVKNLDSASGTFQLVDPDPLAIAGATLDLSDVEGVGQTFVTTLSEANFEGVEKLNVLLGLGNDTWVLNNDNNDLQVEVRGGPSDDEIVIYEIGDATVIAGEQGEEDTMRVIVNGDPEADEFASLIVGAGIERLSIDNTDNPTAEDWYVSQGTLYFGAGKGTAVVSVDDTFTMSDFNGSAPLAVGDRVLVSTVTTEITNNANTADGLNVTRAGAMPSFAGDDGDILLDQSSFYYVTAISGNAFQLALTSDDAAAGIALDISDAGTGTVNITRAEMLVGLEGAEVAEVLGGREDTNGDGRPDENGLAVDTINVVSSLTTTVDITRNTLDIIDGARVLDHSDSLKQGSFPSLRVDGLLGVQSVVTTTGNNTFDVVDALGITRQVTGKAAVFAAGTDENEIAMFVRTVDEEDPTRNYLQYAGFIPENDPDGNRVVPDGPHTIKLSADERFLYVLGTSEIAQFAIGTTISGQPTLTKVASYSGDLTNVLVGGVTDPMLANGTDLVRGSNELLTATGTDALHRPGDLVFSSDGTRVFITDHGSGQGLDDADGVVILKRDVATGLFTEFEQKITRLTDLGADIDVGFDFDSAMTVGTGASGFEASNRILVVDQTLANSSAAGLDLSSERTTFQFHAVAGSVGQQITPYVLKSITEIDHNGDDLQSFEIVATGTTRTIDSEGLNEFSFGLDSGDTATFFDGHEGLYFGWSATGDVVGVATGTASDTHLVNTTGVGISFLDGRQFSIEASFEIEELIGITDAEAIVVTSDESRFFTGDADGAIATFEKNATTGRYEVVSHEAVENVSLVAGAATKSVSLTQDAGVIRADSATDGNVVTIGSTVYEIRNGLLYRGGSEVTIDEFVNGNDIHIRTTTGDTEYNRPVAVATNGSQVFVGIPQADIDDNNPQTLLENDDTGVVLIFDANSNSGTPIGAIRGDNYDSDSGDDFDSRGFGMSLAVDGDVLVVGTKLSPQVRGFFGSVISPATVGAAIFEGSGGNWNLQRDTASFVGSNAVVDVDGDHVIVGTETGSAIYSRQNGGWTEVWRTNQPADDVTIQGGVARIYHGSSVISYREVSADNWALESRLASTVGIKTVSVRDESENYTVSISVDSVSFTAPSDGAGSTAEMLFQALDSRNPTFTLALFGDLELPNWVTRKSGDFEENSASDWTLNFNPDAFGPDGGYIQVRLGEEDGGLKGSNEYSSVATLSTSAGVGTHTATVSWDGEFSWEVSLNDPGEGHIQRTSYADAFGDLSAAAVSGGVQYIADVTRQTATFTGGSISDLALNSAGVLYASDAGAGKVYALNNLATSTSGLDDIPTVIAGSSGNDAPSAIDDSGTATANGGAVNFAVLANDEDIDAGDDPSNFVLKQIDRVRVSGAPELRDLDALDPNAGLASYFQVINGETIQFNPGSDFDFLGAGDSLTFHVDYTMSDVAGAESSARLDVTVTGVNEAPVAVNDSAIVRRDHPTTFNVLSNDTDSDRTDTFENLEIFGLTVNQTGGDPIAAPADLFVVEEDGIAFAPDAQLDGLVAGQSAQFEITYQLRDAAGAVSLTNGTLSLTVNGVDAPTSTSSSDAGGNFTITTVEGAPSTTVNVLAGDPAGTTIPESSVTLLVSDGRSLASFEGTPSVFFDDATGELTVSPGVGRFEDLGAGESVTITISYDAEIPPANAGDPVVVSPRTATITVAGVNDVPIVPAGATLVRDVNADGSSRTVNLLDGILDVEGDVEVTSLTLISGDERGLTVDPANAALLTFDTSVYASYGSGESRDLVYEYTYRDSDGVTNQRNAIIRIVGQNDAILPGAPVTTSTLDGGTPLVVNLLENVQDTDLGDVASIKIGSLRLQASDLAWSDAVTFDEAQGRVIVNPAHPIFDALSDGDLDSNESKLLTFEFTIVDGQGNEVAQTATVDVEGLTETTLSGGIFTLNDGENNNFLGGASGLFLSGDGSRLYVTASDPTVPGAGNDNAVAVYDVIDGGKRLVLTENPEVEGVGAVPDGLSGATDVTSEKNTALGNFVIVASSGDSSLVSFEAIPGDELFFRQGPNPNGLNGLKDQDPASRATLITQMTGNPVRETDENGNEFLTFYAVSGVDDAAYVLTQNADTGQVRVNQLLKDDITGEFGTPDEGLNGAQAIGVSPDGRFVYFGSTQEDDATQGKISVYERATFTREVVDPDAPIPASGEIPKKTITIDGLQQVRVGGAALIYDTDVFQPGVGEENELAEITIDPTGQMLIISGENGTEIYSRNLADGSLTAAGTMTEAFTDIAFVDVFDEVTGAYEKTHAYAVHFVEATGTSDAVSELKVFEVDAAAGTLTEVGKIDTRLDNPKSVVIGPEIKQDFGSTSTDIPRGRFIYVANADNSSITVFDEFARDESDVLIDGQLEFRQFIREGVDGVRGLADARALAFSVAVPNTILDFQGEDIDAANDTIRTEQPHGLRAGQKVWFNSSDDIPTGVTPIASANADDVPVAGDQVYYIRVVDAYHFQLAETPDAARASDQELVVDPVSGNIEGLVDISGTGNLRLHTAVPEGAFLYAISDDAVSTFKRNIDPVSNEIGQLEFMQVIRNRVGNASGGANDGLFDPNSIFVHPDDTANVFIGSSFDPLIDQAPGGFVILHNNVSDSISLPASEIRVDFANMKGLSVTTGNGDDFITVHEAANDRNRHVETTLVKDGGGNIVDTNAITMTFTTGDGFDSLTINDAAADIDADLQEGDDEVTLRSLRDPFINVNAGDGNDKAVVEYVSEGTFVEISGINRAEVDTTNFEANSGLKVTGDDEALGSVNFAKDSVIGSSAALEAIGARIENDDDDRIVYADATVGAEGAAGGTGIQISIVEGEGLVLDASNTQLPDDPIITYGEVKGADFLGSKRVQVTYSWDLNNDGHFTEIEGLWQDFVISAKIDDDFIAFQNANGDIPDNTNLANVVGYDLVEKTVLTDTPPILRLSWEDLTDFGFAEEDIVGSITQRLPLRVTYTEFHFDKDEALIEQDGATFTFQESDDEVTVTVSDALPTLDVTGPSNYEVSLVDTPFELKLDYTDPGNDEIVSWTVNWGDGTSDSYQSEPRALHQYRLPGVYQTSVVAVDDDGNVISQDTVEVTVTFGPDAVAANTLLLDSEITNGAYTINEGSGLTLSGAAAGTPDVGSFSWKVNGVDVGTGESLDLTWDDLLAAGVTNDSHINGGDYDVELTVTYNNGADVVTSRVAPLVVENVISEGDLVNQGQWDQGTTPVLFFENVTDPVDTNFSYEIYIPTRIDYVEKEAPALDPTHPNYAAQLAAIAALESDKTNIATLGLPDGANRAAVIEELKLDVQRGADPSLIEALGDALRLGADPGFIENIGTEAGRIALTYDSGQAELLGALAQIVTEHVDSDGIASATAQGRDALSNVVTNLMRLDPESVDFAADIATLTGLAASIDAVNINDADFEDQIQAFFDQANDLVYIPSDTSHTLPTSLTSEAGVYTVHGRIFDGTGYRYVESEVTVVNRAPQLTIDFNQTVLVVEEGLPAELTGTYRNPGGAPLLNMIAQIEGMAPNESFGNITFSELDESGEGTWTWTYNPDDGPHESQLAVFITAFDSDVSQLHPNGTPSQIQFELQVVNVGPTKQLDPVEINEGDTYTMDLTGAVDQSNADNAAPFTYKYDFGDGNGFVDGGSTANAPDSVLNDDNEVVFRGQIIDKDGTAGEVSQRVIIRNVSPTVSNLAINGPIDETGVATLTGTITDPGTGDDHLVEINWGDGTTDTIFISAEDPADIEITDAGSGFTTSVNVAIAGGSGAGMIVDILAAEDGSLAGLRVVDAGTGYLAGDAITVGNATLKLNAYRDGETTEFSLVHQFNDDAREPALTPSDDLTITVRVTDDDDGVGEASTTLTVNNVDPTVSTPTLTNPDGSPITLNGGGIPTIAGGDTVTLTGTFDDISPEDTHTVTIDWGDGTTDTLTFGGKKTIDFEVDGQNNPLSAGDRVANSFLSQANGHGFTITTDNNGQPAMIFDTANPSAGDFDIATPNIIFGGLGQHAQVVAPGTEVEGAFGTVILNEDGTWTYTVDPQNSSVITQRPGDPVLTDTFSYTLSNGTRAFFEV